jgi:hypothetical protein
MSANFRILRCFVCGSREITKRGELRRKRMTKHGVGKLPAMETVTIQHVACFQRIIFETMEDTWRSLMTDPLNGLYPKFQPWTFNFFQEKT